MNYTPFDEALDKIKRNKTIVESGGQIGIPYPFLRLNKNLSGIQEGEVHIVTAGTGISKSKYTRFVYIYNVYKNYLKTGYRTRIFYFPLEDSQEMIVFHLIIYRLFEHYGIQIELDDLVSKRGSLSDTLLTKIEECREYFGRLFDVLFIYPDVSTPNGIMTIATEWAKKLGTVKYDKEGNINDYDRKITNMHTLFIIDNLSNVTPNKWHKDEHEAIGDLTREKVRKVMAKLFQFTVVLVAQQDLANDRQQFANNGQLVLAKLQPALNALATNKESARDSHIAFGLFAPHRYEIKEWPHSKAYDISVLQDNFRQLSVLKNNEGKGDFRIPLWFQGGIEYYEEMPHYSDLARMQAVYKKAESLREKTNLSLFSN